MSYIKAENVLPQELIETIQQYVDGKLIYIPCKEKQEWGSTTSAKAFFRERNARIYETYKGGMKPRELARIPFLWSICILMRSRRLGQNLLKWKQALFTPWPSFLMFHRSLCWLFLIIPQREYLFSVGEKILLKSTSIPEALSFLI